MFNGVAKISVNQQLIIRFVEGSGETNLAIGAIFTNKLVAFTLNSGLAFFHDMTE